VKIPHRPGLRVAAGATVVFCLSFAACASANKAAVKQTSADSRQALAAGEYGKALELQKQIYQKDPRDKKVLADYVRTIEEAKTAADLAVNQARYGQAASTYHALHADWDGFSAFAEKLTFSKADLEAAFKSCRVALWGAQFRQELGARNYDKALAVYQTALKDYPGDKTLKAAYAGAVDEIETAGRKALTGQDHGLAGKIYALLHRNSASFKGLTTKAAVSRESLAEKVELCRSSLTKAGLAEYRKGNLGKAIAVWERLLAFDPENAEIKKAVETAKAQLGKLKSPI
jgi:tetratricopeptide (TPR) repeat protein